MNKNKKAKRIFKDSKGEYIKKWYFVNGKQKYIKEYVVDGIPVEKFYKTNADPIEKIKNEDYELLINEHYFNEEI